MAGLRRICKMYGGIDIESDGKKVSYVWDYANDKARVKGEMTKDELAASEKAKWMGIKDELEKK